jgi:site-specific DNA-cytosine methylase
MHTTPPTQSSVDPVFFLFAGFPCNSVSSSNPPRKDFAGAEDQSSLSKLQGIEGYVREHHPLFVVLENVMNFSSTSNLSTLCSSLELMEYETVVIKTSPDEHGVPHERLSFWILACDKNFMSKDEIAAVQQVVESMRMSQQDLVPFNSFRLPDNHKLVLEDLDRMRAAKHQSTPCRGRSVNKVKDCKGFCFGQLQLAF